MRPLLERPPRFGLTMALVIGLAAAGNAATNVLAPSALYVPTALAVALLIMEVAVAVGGLDARDLGLAPGNLRSGLRHGAVAVAVVAAVLALGAALPATRGLFADRRVDTHGLAPLLFATLVRIPFGTVALEESLFRGVLLGLGLRRWTPRVAVAVSSLLFGLWHLLPARELSSFNPVVAGATHGSLRHGLAIAGAVVGAALAGAVFCWLRLRSRSLLAPVMLHLASNSLAYAAAWALLRRG